MAAVTAGAHIAQIRGRVGGSCQKWARQAPRTLKTITLGVMIVSLFASIPLLRVSMGRDFHFVQDVVWVERFGIHYHVALDGISLWLVMLTVFTMPIAAYVSFGSIDTRIKDWCFSLLVLQGAMIGALVAMSIFGVLFNLGVYYPLRNRPFLPVLISTLQGNLYELRQFTGLKLLDFELPESFAKQFAGPKYGAQGTRTLTGVKVSPEGQVISEAEWNAKVDDWLPSGSDRAFVASLMGRVVEPGKFANWIAPPVMGINRQPVDFEYVRFN